MKIKLLHVGLSAGDNPPNGLQLAFMREFEYRELNTGTANLNEKIIKLGHEFKPDICFIQIQAGGIIKVETIIELKKLGVFVLHFSGDVREPIPQFYYDLGKHVDFTLFTNQTDVDTMLSKWYRAEFMELGINEKIYCPGNEIIPSHDIVFFGNNYGSNGFPLSQFRIDMVYFMKEKFGDQFGVYGNGWVNASGDFNSSQHKEAAAYRGSKIAINVSHFHYKDYSSDRLLRILGTGTFCLCHSYPDIEKRFKDGKHLVTWNTFEELENYCCLYLDQDDDRKKIGENGRQLCHEKYTFTNLILNIKDLYDRR